MTLAKPREKAIEEAIQRTEIVLVEKSNSSPIMQRIRVIRDQIIEASNLNDLMSFEFLQNKLSCSEYELESSEKNIQVGRIRNIDELKNQ